MYHFKSLKPFHLLILMLVGKTKKQNRVRINITLY